jgi:hypothetical protein
MTKALDRVKHIKFCISLRSITPTGLRGGVEVIVPVEGNITISALSAEMCTNVAASATNAENHSTAVAKLSAEENAANFAADYFVRKRNAKEELCIHYKKKKSLMYFSYLCKSRNGHKTFLVEGLQHCFAQPFLLYKYLAIHGPSFVFTHSHTLTTSHLILSPSTIHQHHHIYQSPKFSILYSPLLLYINKFILSFIFI